MSHCIGIVQSLKEGDGHFEIIFLRMSTKHQLSYCRGTGKHGNRGNGIIGSMLMVSRLWTPLEVWYLVDLLGALPSCGVIPLETVYK